jgi:hypothetical protein
MKISNTFVAAATLCMLLSTSAYASVGTGFQTGLVEDGNALYGQLKSGGTPKGSISVNEYSSMCLYNDRLYYFVDDGSGGFRLYSSDKNSQDTRLVTEFDSSLGDADISDAVIADDYIYVMVNKSEENNTSTLYRVSLKDRSLTKLSSVVGYLSLIGVTDKYIYGYRVIYNDVAIFRTDLDGKNSTDITFDENTFDVFNGYDFTDVNTRTGGFTYKRLCAMAGLSGKVNIIDPYLQKTKYIGDYTVLYNKDNITILANEGNVYSLDRSTNSLTKLEKIGYNDTSELIIDNIYKNNLYVAYKTPYGKSSYSISLKDGTATNLIV